MKHCSRLAGEAVEPLSWDVINRQQEGKTPVRAGPGMLALASEQGQRRDPLEGLPPNVPGGPKYRL